MTSPHLTPLATRQQCPLDTGSILYCRPQEGFGKGFPLLPAISPKNEYIQDALPGRTGKPSSQRGPLLTGPWSSQPPCVHWKGATHSHAMSTKRPWR